MSFKKLIETAKQGQEERDKETLESDPSSQFPLVETDHSKPLAQRKSRRIGKRSNPEYVQALSYLPETLYLRVKQKLLNPEYRGKDYSDLVAELLSQWLDQPK